MDFGVITKCFRNSIGFREERGFNPSEGFSSDLFESESGLYFQSVHPLITYLNLRDCCENEEVAENPEEFSAWLMSKRDDALKTAFSFLWMRKRLHEQTKTLLSETPLLTSPANVHDKEIKQSRFVGYQITIRKDLNVAIILRKIGVQFSERQSSLPLYLYHSAFNEPLSIREINVFAENTPVWQSFGHILKYDDAEKDYNTAWFIGYYEDDLGGQALTRNAFETVGAASGCGSCGGVEGVRQKELAPYVSVSPFYVENHNLNSDRSLWSLAETRFDRRVSWGLNFIVSAQCDLTNLICANRNLFFNMYLYRFAALMLSEIGYSTRNNERKEKVKASALFDLDDRGHGGSVGIKTIAERETDAVNLDFSGLSPLCAPCSRNRLKYASI